MTFSRRTFLQAALAAGAASALGPLDLPAEASVPGKEKLIVNSLRFFDLEAPVTALNTFITPVPLFFVRNHVSEPFAVDLDTWRLKVVGEVERPMSFSLRDLSRMVNVSLINTLECAGNGRAFFEPHVPGIQWRHGAVGTARFSGPRLKDLLARTGLKPGGRHVAFTGLEEPPGKVPQFIRSIPIEKALDADTLVATHMNRVPLLKHHGSPARALVPGWIGAASVKWLREIRVLDREFDGNYMKPGYRMPTSPIAPGADVNPDQTAPVTRLNVKSLISHPGDGARVALNAGAVRISGAAWAGESDITRVEISTDAGASWKEATLGKERGRYAWRLWELAWKPPRAGEYSILSRATDDGGRTQPATGAWNPSGYLWNGYDRVRIHVAA